MGLRRIWKVVRTSVIILTTSLYMYDCPRYDVKPYVKYNVPEQSSKKKLHRRMFVYNLIGS